MSAADPAHRRRADRLTVDAYRLGSAAARVVPARAVSPLASAIGAVLCSLMTPRRQTVEHHLRRVDPSLSGAALRRAAREAFSSYARYYIESFRLPATPEHVVEAGFDEQGYGQLRDAIAAGRGAILALPHLGGWEWAGRWLTDRGYRVTVVVEPLQPPELFTWFADLRSELGMNVVPLGSHAGAAVAKALADNEVVCLLCDRDIGGGGVEVEFFGERTTLPAGPATLALRSRSPLLPTAVYFTDALNGHHAVVMPPVPAERQGRFRADVARVTQALAHDLEALIRRAPDQWHLFQPNWPSDLRPVR